MKKKGSKLGFLLFTGIILYFSPATISYISHIPESSDNKNCRYLENLWEQAGGSSSAAFIAAEIAMAESSGNQYATDYDKDGTVDRGYWQINSSHGSLSTFDPSGNAKAAVSISGNGQDWSQWTTYNNGSYQGRC